MTKRKMFITVIALLLLCTSLVMAAVSFDSDNSKSLFTDVNETDWYYADISYVNEIGLMKGTSETEFSPDDSATRGMIATILWRLEGEPDSVKIANFSDVIDDSYYYNAINWAFENKVVRGYNDVTFGPDDYITREQLTAIIYRYASFKKYDISFQSSLNEFDDKNLISDYALDSFRWAHSKALISGTSNHTLSPKKYASRSQVAAILKRFYTNCMNDSKSLNVITDVNKMAEKNTYTALDKKQNSAPIADKNNFGISTNAESAKYPLLSVSKLSVAAGDNIQMFVSIKNNPGILGMIFSVHYDNSVLKLNSVSNGEALSDVLNLTSSKTLDNGSVYIWDGLAVSPEDVKDGTVLNMNFSVSTNALPGTYPVTVTYNDGDIIDNNLLKLSPSVENGYIKIKE